MPLASFLRRRPEGELCLIWGSPGITVLKQPQTLMKWPDPGNSVTLNTRLSWVESPVPSACQSGDDVFLEEAFFLVYKLVRSGNHAYGHFWEAGAMKPSALENGTMKKNYLKQVSKRKKCISSAELVNTFSICFGILQADGKLSVTSEKKA